MQIESTTTNKRKYIFLLAVILVLELLLTVFPVRTGAAESADTGVLADLKKDPKFNPDDYPSISGDYSLKVIQIAESTDGELLVYVYQPGGKYNPVDATSINISTTKGEDLQFKNYELTLLDRNGVLSKYKIANFSIPKTEERYYEFTSIYRKPVNDSESKVDNGNLIDEVAFAVGKSYTISDIPGGTQSIKVDDVDVIRVTDKYVGFMRYPNGGPIFTSQEMSLDFHFIAFTTDKKIEDLKEADVFYTQQKAEKTTSAGREKFYEKEKKYSYLKFGENIKYEEGRWYNKEYSFPQIEKPEDFLKTEGENKIFKQGIFEQWVTSEVDSEAKNNISDKEWVLRFAYTQYSEVDKGITLPYTDYAKYIVGEVSILRLAFYTNGTYYNLGVVDNKQTGSSSPDNTIKTELKLNDDFYFYLELIIVILLVVFLWNPLCSLFRFLFKILKAFFDVITSPIRFIYRVIFKE